MQNWSDPRTTTAFDPAVSVGVPRAARDAGLRSYMLSVYNYMASGVLLTGIVALGLAVTGVAEAIFFRGGLLRWVAIFAPLVMIINERLAREAFPGQDPIGKRIACCDSDPENGPSWKTVIGVVADVRAHDMSQPADPEFYLPLAQTPQGARHGRYREGRALPRRP